MLRFNVCALYHHIGPAQGPEPLTYEAIHLLNYVEGCINIKFMHFVSHKYIIASIEDFLKCNTCSQYGHIGPASVPNP